MAVDNGDIGELAAEDVALGSGLVGYVDQPVHRLFENQLPRIGVGVDAHLAGNQDGGGLRVDIAEADDGDRGNGLEGL